MIGGATVAWLAILSGCSAQCLAGTALTIEGVRDRLAQEFGDDNVRLESSCVVVLDAPGPSATQVCQWSDTAELTTALERGGQLLPGLLLTAHHANRADLERITAAVEDVDQPC